MLSHFPTIHYQTTLHSKLNNTHMKQITTLLALSYAGLAMAQQQTTAIMVEAEAASNTLCDLIEDTQYSGNEALRLIEASARIDFTIELAEGGKYRLYVAGNGIGGEKIVNCTVNGSTGNFAINEYGEVEVGTFIMKAGKNSVAITPAWTWFVVDYLRIETYTDNIPFDIASHPVDAEATETMCQMYSFLTDNFGQRTISGIMTGDMATANGDVTQHYDVQAVYKKSGQYPALVGFDFMNATGLHANEGWYKDYTRAGIELAKDLHRRGGIPAFTWHWRDPSRQTGEFYSDSTPMKASKALKADGSWDTTSTLYQQIVGDIDVVADYLLELQAEGMACIFRPLHEASGGWFWWGREGADVFKALYRLIYDEMVSVKGVHNVIWVWNPDPRDADWNPGDEYYDVVSADIYNNNYDYSSNYVTFDKLKALTEGKKLVALSENGPIPDIDRQSEEGAMWSWWMPWYQSWNGGFVDKTSSTEWQHCMNDPRVVTLDDMKNVAWSTLASIDEVRNDFATNGRVYDLQGRIIKANQKGFYLQKDAKSGSFRVALEVK